MNTLIDFFKATGVMLVSSSVIIGALILFSLIINALIDLINFIVTHSLISS